MKTKTILVIEDHESLRKLIGHFLSKQYNVITQPDAIQGLAWMQAGNIPDLIILDMSMPRLSGIEFLSHIRSSGFFSHVPVVVVSGEENKSLIEQCKKLNVLDYINKPFDPIKLNETIATTLNETSGGRRTLAS